MTAERVADVRVAIIGAGFSGIGMAVNLKRAGIEDFVVLERAHELGGTWRANTYPGCQCDVPSTLYSFSFAPNSEWTRTFPLQEEIWSYLRRIAEEQRLTPHFRLGHDVTSCRWDQRAGRWAIETSRGSLTARVLVLGVGALSTPSVPRLPGAERFRGASFHSADWNHGHDLRGERVAVIGTGASAIQFVPRIAPVVSELHVHQRTPAWILPHPDRAVSTVERRVWRAIPRSQHLWRGVVWGSREALVVGLTVEPRLMRLAEAVAKRHLHAQVPDAQLRERLVPRYRLGCKRILVSNDFYPTLCRPNVQLITTAIRAINSRSVVLQNGEERDVDTIIYATGFRATDPPAAHYVQGRSGQTLAEVWKRGMSAYLGCAIAGFPNAFMLTGPNTGLGHSSMIYMIESQIAYIVAALRAMDTRGVDVLEVRPEVQAAYNAQLQARLRRTVWNSGGCRSWYLDPGGRNTTLWPSFTFRFRSRCRSFNLAEYTRSTRPAPPPRSPPVVAAG